MAALTTPEYIEYLKKRVKRSEIKALASTDPVDRARHERRAKACNLILNKLQLLNNGRPATADRKF